MLILIALSAALVQTPPAPPPGAPVQVHSRFVFVGAGADGPGSLDADNDGQVTREEFAAPLNDAFSKMDKDGDGRLSSQELAADTGSDDANVTVRRLGGGEVERFELRRRGSGGEGVARFERDGDPAMVFVTPDGDGPESRVFVRTRPGGAGARVVQFGRGPEGGRPGRIEVRTSDRHGADDLDKDGDGKVSEAEFTAPLREAFARLDADHSGFVEDGEHDAGNSVHVFAHRVDGPDGE